MISEREKTISFELDIPLFRPDRPDIRKVLGDLEADIMELIKQRPAGDGTTVRDIFEILYQQRPDFSPYLSSEEEMEWEK